MGLFQKKSDPISQRAQALDAQIEALENRLKLLNKQMAEEPEPPKWRSTALPASSPSTPSGTSPTPAAHDPIFEPVDVDRLKMHSPGMRDHYNDLGVRKYDLFAVWRRMLDHFRGPTSTNPQLVNYLAAGSIQGLRPLRYEKRVARNRFFLLAACFLIILWIILVAFLKQ